MEFRAHMKTNSNIALGTQYGDRTLKVIAANIGDIRNITTLPELDIRQKQIDIDIVCVHETRRAESHDLNTQEYRYISDAAKSTQRYTDDKELA